MFNWLNVVIFIVFCSMQVYRASLEEKKMASAFPQYREYAAQVGWLGSIGRKE